MDKTLRQQIIDLLEESEHSARELSFRLRIKEKEVYTHLPHIGRSVSAGRRKLQITPAECLSCGFVFKDRRRFTSPGRCPRCRREHISEPLYRIATRKSGSPGKP